MARGGWGGFARDRWLAIALAAAMVPLYLWFRESADLPGPAQLAADLGVASAVIFAIVGILSGYLRRHGAASAVLSPHRRHSNEPEPRVDESFAKNVDAFAAFLEDGDDGRLRRRMKQWDPQAERSLQPVLETEWKQPPPPVPPGFLWGSHFLNITLISLLPLAGSREIGVMGWLVAGLMLWASQWVAFGGPWWSPMVVAWIGTACIAVFTEQMGGFRFAPAIWYSVVAALALLPFLHALVRRERPYKFKSATYDDPERSPWIEVLIRMVFAIVAAALLIELLAQFFEVAGWDPAIASMRRMVWVMGAMLFTRPLILAMGWSVAHKERQETITALRKERRLMLQKALGT